MFATSWKEENPFGLPFSREEYAKRLAAVRARMKKEGLDHILVTGPHNIYYLTGYRTTGYYVYQMLVVPIEGELRFVTSKLEHTNVETLSWAREGLSVTMTDDPLDVTIEAAEQSGVGSGGVGYEDRAFFLPARILDGLRQRFHNTAFKPTSGLVEGVRAVKSAQEIGYIRKAAEIASLGMRVGIAASREGRMENEVAGKVYDAMLSAGGEHPSGGPYVITGPRAALAHALPERVRMERGHCVYFEVGGIFKRYAASNMRMVSIGKPSAETQRVADTMIGAIEAIVKAMKPGALSEEVDAAGRPVVEKAGLGRYFHHRCGYSMGCSFPPGWGEGTVMDISQGNKRPLEAGMVFHCVPLVVIPEWGCMGFSETILVTKDGSEVLTHVPRELAVAA
ncbi:MAG: aminopeptidase P family protein [Alphaproteobacteria bacterium]|nr:aminopeptidase P family protein [Alphaproteobacteria bacterium]